MESSNMSKIKFRTIRIKTHSTEKRKSKVDELQVIKKQNLKQNIQNKNHLQLRRNSLIIAKLKINEDMLKQNKLQYKKSLLNRRLTLNKNNQQENSRILQQIKLRLLKISEQQKHLFQQQNSGSSKKQINTNQQADIFEKSAVNSSKLKQSVNSQAFYELNSNNKKEIPTLIQKIGNQKLTISNQFSQKFIFKFQLKDSSTQTIRSAAQQRNFVQYMKARQIKIKMFDQIEEKYKNLKKMIEQTQQFKQNHKQLIQYLNEKPQNDREERVFALSIDLQKQQLIFKNHISSFLNNISNYEDKCAQKITNSLKKQSNLENFISNQLKIILNLFNTKKIDPKYSRIINRIINQSKNYSSNNDQLISNFKKYFNYISIETKKIFSNYTRWSDMLLQNRILLANFIKQIEQIPFMTNSLFGSKQNQFFYGYKFQTSDQDKIRQLLTIKCEKCFDYKQKIKYIEFKNHQIKPILKSLEWLLRDANKKTTPFSII